MEKKTIEDIDVHNKRVLVRVDFNVPLDKSTGEIKDDARIQAALPTIQYLVDHQSKIILCSHLGRPDGQVKDELRLTRIGEHLSSLLNIPVRCAPDCIGPEAEQMADELRSGEVLLLENLRFHPEETKNDPAFARALANLADIYINDAFGTAHRAHASTAGVAQFLPAVSGFLMEKEIRFLGKALADPSRPFAMVIGGAKVADKIALLENIVEKVDSLLIGGGMANTFLKARGIDIGSSKVEDDQLDFSLRLMEQANTKGKNILLPLDGIVAEKMAPDAQCQIVDITDIPRGWIVLDIGPRTIDQFKQTLKSSKTIVWNGPMGVFEYPRFAEGTNNLAKFIADLNATTIVGGGDSASAVKQLGLTDKLTHVSTGGGASLEFLEGKVLPGVAVLQDK